jgi:hypothetical protein
MVVDYTEEPYKVVYFNRFKGGDISIPMQYELVRDVSKRFNSKVIIDSSALGGKNAMAFLNDLNPISAEFGPTRTSTMKAEMLATLKIALDGGNTDLKRDREKVDNKWTERKEVWGLIRFPEITVLINELTNYKLDDTQLRTDCVMALAMIVHYLEMRRPRKQAKPWVDIDFLS